MSPNAAVPPVLTSPVNAEDMFLAWLFALPAEAVVAEAARSEIARIDREAIASESLSRLRGMLVQATFHQPCLPRRRRRQHH